MNTTPRTRTLQSGWRWCLHAAAALLLLGCATAPLPDTAAQRFDAAYRLGSEKFAAGDLAQAASAFAQAERMAALYDRRAQRLQALLSQGAVAATREQDAVALSFYTQAQAEAQGLGDAHNEAVARVGVAEVQRRAGDYPAALQSFDQALAPKALRAESAERLQARIGQALVLNATGKGTQARDALQVLETQARGSLGDGAGGGANALLSAVLANQAVLLRDAGNLPAAIAKADEALAHDQRLANPFAIAADLELLGTLYQRSGRSAEARTSLARALRIAEATGQTRSAERLRLLLR